MVLLIHLVPACSDSSVPHQDAKVQIRKTSGQYQLYRNGQPFEIRGVAGHERMKKLKETGGNTIRVYDTTNLGDILDSAQANDLAVIAGVWMMGDKEMDYTDSFKVAQQHEAIRHVVRKHKDHPALLMWCLGNELAHWVKLEEMLFPKGVWKAFSEVAEMIHREDPDHPVTTTIPGYQLRHMLFFELHVPELDIIGINSFGRLNELAEESNKYHWLFDEPYFVAEWAIQGPWEAPGTPWKTPYELSSSQKAEMYKLAYEEHIPHDDPYFLGSCVFYWGQKQEHTHTWFGLFSEKGEKSQMLEAIELAWGKNRPQNLVPRVDSVLINARNMKDTLIFGPGEKVSAEVFVHDPEGDNLKVEWEVLPDVWHFDYRAINHKPKPVGCLFQQSGFKNVGFSTPAEAGSYRLYVKITDPINHMFGTANIPFLIVE